MVINWIKRIVKIAISLAYFALVAIARSGLRLIGRSPGDGLVVLYYHGVPDKFRGNFKRQMNALRRGARVVPASYRGSLPPGKKHVAITFDDALVSIARNALPELASRSFHATIFVPVGWTGRPPAWTTDGEALDPDDVVMTIEELKRISSPLVSLGAHTLNHPILTKLDKERMWEEIEGSRSRLVELSGGDVRSFSFPYGDYDATCVAACQAAGYESVFSILPEEIDTARSAILRGRTMVDPSDGPIEFFLKFRGAYVWAAQIAPITRRLRAVVAMFSQPRGSKQDKERRTLAY